MNFNNSDDTNTILSRQYSNLATESSTPIEFSENLRLVKKISFEPSTMAQ